MLNSAVAQVAPTAEATERSNITGGNLGDYKEWLMESGRKAGDATVVDKADGSGSYVVVFLDRSDNHYPVAQVRHILIKAVADSDGSYTDKAKLFDVVLANGAVSESNYARVQSGFEGDITLPSQTLNDKLRASATRQGIPLIEGNIHSSDVFYRQPSEEKPTYWEKLRDERGCLCVEMESFALFANAQVLGKNAACLLTISDSFVSPEITTAEQRQTSFTNMMKVALGAEY